MPDPSAYGQVPQPQPQQPQAYPYDPQSGGYPQQPGQQPGYPQPAYGQPEYPGYPQPPVKKSNTALIATVAAAVLVVGGGITAALMLTGKSSPTPHAGGTSSQAVVTPSPSASSSPSSDASPSASGSLTIPTSVSGLTLLDNADAKDAVAQMRKSLTSDAELYPDPVIAAYNDGGGDNVTELFENQALADLGSSGKDALSGYSSSDIVSQLMTGAGISNAKDEQTSATDGALSCGSRKLNSVDVVFCFWDDNTSFGGVEFFNSASLSDDAATADSVRAASEGS
jgi:hypothetical protein